jgi:transcriptional regulator with XRE-family HTH domain
MAGTIQPNFTPTNMTTAAQRLHTLNSKGYPDAWPRANTQRPDSVVSRITDAQKKALYERELTTRELAEKLGVREAYLSSLFPGKRPCFVKAKKMLAAARKEYRQSYAKQVILGSMSLKDAAAASRVPYRTMARIVKALKVHHDKA